MTTITVPVDERWMASNGFGRDTVEPELRLVLAAKLYELRRATLGQAAAMAGLSIWQFTDALPRLGVSLVNATQDQLREDLQQA
jgi:predicted HTH domain antitoxin